MRGVLTSVRYCIYMHFWPVACNLLCVSETDGHISVSAGGLTTATPQVRKQAVLIHSTHTEKTQDLGHRRTRHGPRRERERAREKRGEEGVK